jgi:hypothetical protein
MRGALNHRDHPDYVAEVTALGRPRRHRRGCAIVDAGGTDRHRSPPDRQGRRPRAALSGATLDELARTVRLKVGDTLPRGADSGHGAEDHRVAGSDARPRQDRRRALPLTATVSQVNAVGGRPWIGVHLEPGDVVKTTDAPAARAHDRHRRGRRAWRRSTGAHASGTGGATAR